MSRHAVILMSVLFAAAGPALERCAAQIPPPPGIGQDFQRGRESPPPKQGNSLFAEAKLSAFVPESLDDAWRVALAVDQRVAAGDMNLSAADHASAAARAERYPSLNLGANYFALSDQLAISANVPPLPAAQFPFVSRDSLGFNATVNQPIYTSGRITSGIEAADADIDAHQAESARLRLDVKMNVAELYIAVLRAIRVVEVNGSRVASLSAHARDVENRFDKGMASRNDLLAVQVALADAQQQAVQARNAEEMLCSAYNRALRRRLTEPVHLVEISGGDEPGNLDPGNLDELTRLACAGRPELAALSAEARALRAQADAVRAESAPQVAVSGGYLYQQDKYIDPNGMAGVALTAQWNAFDAGRNKEQAMALLERSEALLRMKSDAESTIALEVRQKWLEVQTARDRLQFARKATAQADENLRVVRGRYLQGLATNTEVLDGETLRAQAYMNLYNSYYESILAGLRVHRAVGNL